MAPSRKKRSKYIREDALDLFRAWGREGGKTGGKLRWEGVTPEQRRDHARKAAKARWAKKREEAMKKKKSGRKP